MNLHKRSCYSTWVPRKIRERIVFIREEWPFPERGLFDQPSYIYIYIFALILHPKAVSLGGWSPPFSGLASAGPGNDRVYNLIVYI